MNTYYSIFTELSCLCDVVNENNEGNAKCIIPDVILTNHVILWIMWIYF